MLNKTLFLHSFLITTSLFFIINNSYSQISIIPTSYLKNIQAPKNLQPLTTPKKVIIAIVDDGVRVTHEGLRDFIWINPKEVINNIDDDGNGLIDDINGWDMSDNDNDVMPPEFRLKDFKHGTELAGIIVNIVRHIYGKNATDYIQILPVKTLTDNANSNYLDSAFQGIDYAIDAGADIILTAWGVNRIRKVEKDILKKAHKNNILIIASAGNFPEEKIQYPAGHETVLSVAAIDNENKKLSRSNFGNFIDLSAIGSNIPSTSVYTDTAYSNTYGTSSSAAIVATAAAIIKLNHPKYTNSQIKACLISSTDSLSLDELYQGKMGAGKLNIESAIKCEIFSKSHTETIELSKAQGYLYFNSKLGSFKNWLIQPDINFVGLRFIYTPLTGDLGEGQINFFHNNNKNAKLLSKFDRNNVTDKLFITSKSPYVTFNIDDSSEPIEWLIHYKAETTIYRKLYCHSTKRLNKPGIIEDGSAENSYALNSDCKWLITAPKGKKINFIFSEFDTEEKTDLVYFFNGIGTQEKIMAIFSGHNIPPEFTSWSNQVLVWFVSDKNNQGKGWKANYKFID